MLNIPAKIQIINQELKDLVTNIAGLGNVNETLKEHQNLSTILNHFINHHVITRYVKKPTSPPIPTPLRNNELDSIQLTLQLLTKVINTL